MRPFRLHLPRVAASAVLALAGATGACGYAVVRPAPPFGLTRIAVVPFLEDEPAGIAPDLATELAERLAQSGVRLTTDRATADAVLTGRVLAMATRNAPVATPTSRIQMYRVSLALLATLTRGTEEVWRTRIDVTDDFLPATPPSGGTDNAYDLGTEANRREALRRLTRVAAQTVADALFVASSTAPASTAPPLAPPPSLTPAPAAPVPASAAGGAPPVPGPAPEPPAAS